MDPQQFEIQEIIDAMEDENGYNIQFEESQNKESVELYLSSYFSNQSHVNFKSHGVIINKFGAKRDQQNLLIFQINSDYIKEVKKIGKGSAGEVWLANYLHNGKQVEVAIKEIPVAHKQSRDQFLKDLKVFLTSDSPYVVKFYGCFYKEGFLNEVIEYMNLGSLRNLIDFNKSKCILLEDKILSYISFCILSGLEYIHSKYQIHRDIKPENILINSSGTIKITDFGIYKQLQKTYQNSKTWVGTQIYMSPERISGKQYEYNCDVWSFGLILYELTTNRDIPYRPKTKNEPPFFITQKILNLPAPAFLQTDGRSPQLSHFLSRCLDKDYKSRATVSELLNHPWLTKNLQQNSGETYFRNISNFLK